MRKENETVSLLTEIFDIRLQSAVLALTLLLGHSDNRWNLICSKLMCIPVLTVLSTLGVSFSTEEEKMLWNEPKTTSVNR